MRPVNRGACPTDTAGNQVQFAHYRDARDDLIERIGDYCSYCEICLHSSIPVEHVRPKSLQPTLEREWTNFLFACDSCNRIKSDHDVNIADYFWPDRENTALAFDHHLDQPPQPSSKLPPALRTVAEATIELTGLDRAPGHPRFKPSDRRWLKRQEAWGVAIQSHRDLRANDTPQMRTMILHTAVSRGFWSVWFQVFQDDVEFRRSLIEWFRGTAQDCFDAQTQPIPRAGGLV